MKILPVIIYFSIAGLSISASLTPDAKVDFQKISDAYKYAPGLSIDVHYALYQDTNSKKAAEEKNGTIMIGKNYYYNRLGDIEILRDKSFGVVADRSRRMLILSKLSRKQQKNKTLPLDLDSALQEYKNITYKETGQGKGEYDLEFKSCKIAKMTIVFSRNTYLVDELELDYGVPVPESGQAKTPPRIVIRYVNRSGRLAKQNTITVSNFVRIENGKYIPTGIYKNYEFINNLNQ